MLGSSCILLNDRSGIPGDFSTPEQSISVLPPFGRWEACMTTNDTWGWHATDHHWKTPEQIVRALAVCASGAGNLLLNIGPKGDGSVPAPAADLLEAVGGWLAVTSIETVPSLHRGSGWPCVVPLSHSV